MDSSLAVVSTAQVRRHLIGEGPGGVEVGRPVVQGSVLPEGVPPSLHPGARTGWGGFHGDACVKLGVEGVRRRL